MRTTLLATVAAVATRAVYIAPDPERSQVRVLIVSPDPHERARAGSALDLERDVEVVEVTGGAEAAAHLRDATFDALVIDGDLYPKGGFSWLYELRAQAQMHGTQRPPAIVMTARPQDKFLADWSGAEAMVAKPVDGFDVQRIVTELVGVAPAGV